MTDETSTTDTVAIEGAAIQAIAGLRTLNP